MDFLRCYPQLISHRRKARREPWSDSGAGLVPERCTRSPHTLMVTATWTVTVTRMAQRHTAQRLSPHVPIFERLCYIKKQYEGTMAFITPTIRARATSSSAVRGHTWRRCSSGGNISRGSSVQRMRTAKWVRESAREDRLKGREDVQDSTGVPVRFSSRLNKGSKNCA